MEDYSGKCATCNKMNTTGRGDSGEFQCSSCSNQEYYSDLLSGKRSEIKIKWSDYRPGFKDMLTGYLAEHKLIKPS